jgi:energy-coupling factor transport system permease protein
MFKNVSLGTYYPGNSVLHRLQARTKLLLLLWFIIFLTIANNHFWHFAPYIVLLILALLAVALSGVRPHHMWQRMRLLVLFALIGAVPTLFTTDSESSVKPLYHIGPFTFSFALVRWTIIAYGALLTLYILLHFLPIPALQKLLQKRRFKRSRIPLILLTLIVIVLLWFTRNIPLTNTFPVGPFVITDLGVWLLASFSAVFLALFTFSLLLTMTTAPIALIEGMTLLLTPLRWLKLPVEEFALMTLIALRFIPTLIEEVEQLIKAQTSRGADYSQGTIRERVQSLIALFVPFMQGVLRRAADLSTALEARGYEVEGKRTLLYEKSLGGIDYMVLCVVGVITVGSLVV